MRDGNGSQLPFAATFEHGTNIIDNYKGEEVESTKPNEESVITKGESIRPEEESLRSLEEKQTEFEKALEELTNSNDSSKIFNLLTDVGAEIHGLNYHATDKGFEPKTKPMTQPEEVYSKALEEIYTKLLGKFNALKPSIKPQEEESTNPQEESLSSSKKEQKEIYELWTDIGAKIDRFEGSGKKPEQLTGLINQHIEVGKRFQETLQNPVKESINPQDNSPSKSKSEEKAAIKKESTTHKRKAFKQFRRKTEVNKKTGNSL